MASKNRARRRLLRPSPDAARHPLTACGERDGVRGGVSSLPPHLPRDAPAVALVRKLRSSRLAFPPQVARRYRAGVERLFAEMSREYIDERRLRELLALLIIEGDHGPPHRR